ncbi:MAG TPA: hypothetical protein VH300_12600 [Thermoleophilaceae bacterium]|jgi:hypothetical protein|nr:hypothetical protein [Thermoleophilaceae bacterium]
MPTRIFFANGEQVTVSDSPDAVAEKLASGGFARLDRPWGDESIYVNPSSINYIEAQDERAPDIAALEAVPDSGPTPAPAPAIPGAGAPQMPGQVPPGGPGQVPPAGPGQFPPR